jgi:hypothetical protein
MCHIGKLVGVGSADRVWASLSLARYARWDGSMTGGRFYVNYRVDYALVGDHSGS